MTTPLKLAGALGHEAADKRIDILRRIGQAGSISEAARAAGVSYKAAWQAIDTLGNLAGSPQVAIAVDGAGGGGARLTPAGRQLLQAADEMARAREQALARLDGRRGAAAAAVAAALGMRTSMRNQLPCSVKAMKTAGGMVRVELALADGGMLAARITRESAQLLALAPGLPVLALCKATAVHVGATIARAAGRNLLRGSVTRASRAAGGGEVALALDAGLQLVGFAGSGHGLKPRSAAMASVDETAVVIALAA
ncbi:TOBE domain-containing protein [Caenimonas terrae]|uniref:TOBE domain-containing protein n=1 Tax=Caenimonas terrae TaxID=696074 RepID=A0ABW0ND10_9BURK